MNNKPRKTPQLTLRARGLAPSPNYIIRPAAGSLVGDIPALRDDPERANAMVARILANCGARNRPHGS